MDGSHPFQDRFIGAEGPDTRASRDDHYIGRSHFGDAGLGRERPVGARVPHRTALLAHDHDLDAGHARQDLYRSHDVQRRDGVENERGNLHDLPGFP